MSSRQRTFTTPVGKVRILVGDDDAPPRIIRLLIRKTWMPKGDIFELVVDGKVLPMDKPVSYEINEFELSATGRNI